MSVRPDNATGDLFGSDEDAPAAPALAPDSKMLVLRCTAECNADRFVTTTPLFLEMTNASIAALDAAAAQVRLLGCTVKVNLGLPFTRTYCQDTTGSKDEKRAFAASLQASVAPSNKHPSGVALSFAGELNQLMHRGRQKPRLRPFRTTPIALDTAAWVKPAPDAVTRLPKLPCLPELLEVTPASNGQFLLAQGSAALRDHAFELNGHAMVRALESAAADDDDTLWRYLGGLSWRTALMERDITSFQDDFLKRFAVANDVDDLMTYSALNSIALLDPPALIAERYAERFPELLASCQWAGAGRSTVGEVTKVLKILVDRPTILSAFIEHSGIDRLKMVVAEIERRGIEQLPPEDKQLLASMDRHVTLTEELHLGTAAPYQQHLRKRHGADNRL